MLILMVMCLEVVLPAKICLADSKNGYVIYNNVKMERDKFKKVGDEFIYIPSETDWYNTLFLVKMEKSKLQPLMKMNVYI